MAYHLILNRMLSIDVLRFHQVMENIILPLTFKAAFTNRRGEKMLRFQTPAKHSTRLRCHYFQWHPNRAVTVTLQSRQIAPLSPQKKLMFLFGSVHTWAIWIASEIGRDSARNSKSRQVACAMALLFNGTPIVVWFYRAINLKRSRSFFWATASHIAAWFITTGHDWGTIKK